MQTKKHAATIRDVARVAGVSVSTVSRVLNGKVDVASETQERIRAVIAELNYTSNLAARSMRSHHNHVIGLVMPDVATPYCLEVMNGVNWAIAHSDYDLIIYTNGDSNKYGKADHERQFVALINGNITDGVVVVTPFAADFVTDFPVVVIDPNNEKPDHPSIIATNQAGVMELMAYLTILGHRRIGFISGREGLVSSNHRLQGYKDGLAAAGIPLNEELIQKGDYSAELAVPAAQKLLSLAQPPTAILAANDMSAMGVYQAAKDMGLRIPQDLSVAGFDNIHEASLMNPGLTTVDQFLSNMGIIAIEMVIKMVNGERLESNQHKINTQLVVRDSCCSIAESSNKL